MLKNTFSFMTTIFQYIVFKVAPFLLTSLLVLLYDRTKGSLFSPLLCYEYIIPTPTLERNSLLWFVKVLQRLLYVYWIPANEHICRGQGFFFLILLTNTKWISPNLKLWRRENWENGNSVHDIYKHTYMHWSAFTFHIKFSRKAHFKIL